MFGTFQLNRLARCGRWIFQCIRAVALGQYQAIVERLIAAGTPRRPGYSTVALSLIDADAIIVGNEAFVEADVVLIERRYEHLRLDGRARDGLEFQSGIEAPDVVGFILGDRDVQHVDLVSGDGQTQADQYGDQDFQVQIDRLHSLLNEL